MSNRPDDVAWRSQAGPKLEETCCNYSKNSIAESGHYLKAEKRPKSL
jgi:hypothetical protein